MPPNEKYDKLCGQTGHTERRTDKETNRQSKMQGKRREDIKREFIQKKQEEWMKQYKNTTVVY